MANYPPEQIETIKGVVKQMLDETKQRHKAIAVNSSLDALLPVLYGTGGAISTVKGVKGLIKYLRNRKTTKLNPEEHALAKKQRNRDLLTIGLGVPLISLAVHGAYPHLRKTHKAVKTKRLTSRLTDKFTTDANKIINDDTALANFVAETTKLGSDDTVEISASTFKKAYKRFLNDPEHGYRSNIRNINLLSAFVPLLSGVIRDKDETPKKLSDALILGGIGAASLIPAVAYSRHADKKSGILTANPFAKTIRVKKSFYDKYVKEKN